MFKKTEDAIQQYAKVWKQLKENSDKFAEDNLRPAKLILNEQVRSELKERYTDFLETWELFSSTITPVFNSIGREFYEDEPEFLVNNICERVQELDECLFTYITEYCRIHKALVELGACASDYFSLTPEEAIQQKEEALLWKWAPFYNITNYADKDPEDAD